MVNSPAHYNDYSVEVIDMMVDIWGLEAVAKFCEINAFKYRMRLGLKTDNIAEDLKKERWYLNKQEELLKLIDAERNVNEVKITKLEKSEIPVYNSGQEDWDEYHNQDGEVADIFNRNPDDANTINFMEGYSVRIGDKIYDLAEIFKINTEEPNR